MGLQSHIRKEILVNTLKPLTVKFNEVPSAGLNFKFDQKSGELNSVLFDILGDFPVYSVEVNLKPNEEMVHLKGHLTGELNHICSRCAEEYLQPYNKSFVTAFYKSEENLKNLATMDDLEGSFDLEFLEGNEIKLSEVIHEQIALEIPFKPLCSVDCKGLCPQCGTNLNVDVCHCAEKEITPKTNPAFEKLKILNSKALRGE